MENHHSSWVNPLFSWAIFNSYFDITRGYIPATSTFQTLQILFRNKFMAFLKFGEAHGVLAMGGSNVIIIPESRCYKKNPPLKQLAVAWVYECL